MCDCYKIGGPWIAEDPDCPEHGYAAQQRQRERESKDSDIEDRMNALESQVVMLRAIREMAEEAADRGDVLGQRIVRIIGT